MHLGIWLEDDFFLQEQMNTDVSMLARRSTDWLERFLQGDADWRAEVKSTCVVFIFARMYLCAVYLFKLNTV